MQFLLMLLLFGWNVLLAQANNLMSMNRQFAPKYNPYFNGKAFDRANKPVIDYRPTGKTPQPANAGVTILNFEDQIVGGKKATRGQFPWQVLLTLDEAYMCGGSLISTDWILTAAHCSHEITDFTVTVGVINKVGKENSKVVLKTKNKFVHKDYDNVYLTSDIALLKLPSSVDISGPFVTPIRLPRAVDARKTAVNKVGMISGWGKTGDDDGTSDYLKFVERKIVDNKNCAKLYGNVSISAASLCISNVDLQGTCNGDSGGPFVIKEADKKFTQIGLVSFGSSSSCVRYPSCFTRVASYLGWISDTTGLQIRL